MNKRLTSANDQFTCWRSPHLVIADVEAWCRVAFVASGGSKLGSWEVRGLGAPDLAVVDGLARLQLLARRLGGSIRLQEVCEELGELLDLAGLGREMGGEPKGREE
jgi:hypothetical protein